MSFATIKFEHCAIAVKPVRCRCKLCYVSTFTVALRSSPCDSMVVLFIEDATQKPPHTLALQQRLYEASQRLYLQNSAGQEMQQLLIQPCVSFPFHLACQHYIQQ